ncbi:hypothetical protein [Corynebacterium glutamicum]|uniref:hypothetical protein n=1 Tax=Corynebacterium glutamicum TaxID=1718 RepID=UPI000A49E270|nr:hypothetical protein [Corynebacterium glutamicum]
MQKPFEDLSWEFAASIAEVVDAHAGTFDGQKVTGLALCPADDHLVPYLGVVFARDMDDPDAPIEEVYGQWSPEESGGGKSSNERLDAASNSTNDLASAWPEEGWASFGPLLHQALVEAPGAQGVRHRERTGYPFTAPVMPETM